MKHLKFILASGLAIATAALTSCDRYADVAGSWTGMPDRSLAVAGAIDATSTISLDFAQQPASKAKDNGLLTISASIDANQPVTGGDFENAAYEVSVAASASMTGTWTFVDDDDIVVSLDPSTFTVTVDPDGVTFAEDLVSGMQQPQLDSLSTATATRWQNVIEPAIKTEFLKYGKLDDIKIKNGIMTFEINDRDYTFRRNSTQQ
jgi:lipoprotein